MTEKVRVVSIGECPKCHKTIVRGYPIDVAVCACESAIEVPLQPAFAVSRKYHVMLENLAVLASVSVDRLVDVLLDTYIDELYAKGLVNLAKEVKR